MSECDHDWRLVRDWGGDPNVINGTFDCSFARCAKCGEEEQLENVDLSDDGPEYDDDRASHER